jgi:hypothetical protein
MWAHSANEEGNRHALVDHLYGTARHGWRNSSLSRSVAVTPRSLALLTDPWVP